MFQGSYHGKQYHEADLPAVLERSWAAGLQRIIITATNLEESKAALALARTHGERAGASQRELRAGGSHANGMEAVFNPSLPLPGQPTHVGYRRPARAIVTSEII